MKKRGIRGVRETDMMSEADPWTEAVVYCEDSTVVATLKMGKEDQSQGESMRGQKQRSERR